MARIIAVANQKGGVGKTTSTLNLGAALQELDQSVLLVDLDPQASLTMSVGLNPETLSQTLFNVLSATIHEDATPTLGDVIVATPAGLDIAPADIELSGAEIDLSKATMGELVLREVLSTVQDRYDFILIDCPPSLGLLTINALSAANQVFRVSRHDQLLQF